MESSANQMLVIWIDDSCPNRGRAQPVAMKKRYFHRTLTRASSTRTFTPKTVTQLVWLEKHSVQLCSVRLGSTVETQAAAVSCNGPSYGKRDR
mmetsp:Transcript_7147/g.12856  ORF Transcript_7147/g.12856 Transcript_7147/m.12856 type:complete len:93 (-) Transcript_7147:2074-2352(-)